MPNAVFVVDAYRDRRPAIHWPALSMSLLLNAAVVLGLLWAHQRARSPTVPPIGPQTRIPIQWLPPMPVPPPSASADTMASTAAWVAGQRPAPAASARTRSQPAESVARPVPDSPQPRLPNDDWGQAAAGASHGRPTAIADTIAFADDPLRLRRQRDFPVRIERLKLRLRSGGFASIAQRKACAMAYAQFNMMSSPNGALAGDAGLMPGMQPAGREALWRTLENNRCFD